MSEPEPLLGREGIEEAVRRLGDRLAKRGSASGHDQRGALVTWISPVTTGTKDRAKRNQETMTVTLERLTAALEKTCSSPCPNNCIGSSMKPPPNAPVPQRVTHPGRDMRCSDHRRSAKTAGGWLRC